MLHSVTKSMLLLCTVGLSLPVSAQVQPLTNVNVSQHTGYFADPYYVPYVGAGAQIFFGTTNSKITCGSALAPNCGTINNLNNIDTSLLDAKAKSANAEICNLAGLHPFQNKNFMWHMAVTMHVRPKGECGDPTKSDDGWSMIAHAQVVGPDRINQSTPPTNWQLDTVLIGRFAKDLDGNYDGKYFETSSKLFLVYQKEISGPPNHRVGIYAQELVGPQQATNDGPTLLLRPDEGADAKRSEDYDKGTDGFKLVETANIVQINGKFLMAYSTGSTLRPTYKASVAWSDTFLPPGNNTYRKVTQINPNKEYGTEGRENYYLAQSDNPNWTNYIGNKVKSPGVPTVAQIGPSGQWVMMFAGYDPNDIHNDPHTDGLDGSYRRPYYMLLNVNVPANATVFGPNAVTDDTLNGWVTPR